MNFEFLIPGSRKPLLERLLDKASKSSRHRDTFYRALLDEMLWVPGTIDNGDVFVQPFDLDGRRTILIFSSEGRLNESLRKNAGAIEVRGRTLLEALPSFDAVVLDYATRLQKEMTPSEIAALLDGSIFGLMRDNASVQRTMLGRPKHYPMQLLNALRPVLQRYPSVRAAYLCQAQDESATDARMIIALECIRGGDVDVFNEGLIEVARCVATVDTSMQVIALGSDATSEFMRRETEPWWEREELT